MIPIIVCLALAGATLGWALSGWGLRAASGLQASGVAARLARPAELDRRADGALRTLGLATPLNARTARSLAESLELSGSPLTVSQLWLLQVSAALLGAVVGTLAATELHAPPLPCALIAAACGFAIPRLAVIAWRSSWHRQLSRELPDLLDLLSVTVSAGVTLDDGLRIVAQAGHGALAQACDRIAQRSRQEPVAQGLLAFSELTALADLRCVAVAICHASESGASVGRTLREQAQRLRTQRKLQIDEAAAKLDNQITVVCGLLVMPAAFAAAVLPYAWSIFVQFQDMGGL